jgi:hypothetical protein
MELKGSSLRLKESSFSITTVTYTVGYPENRRESVLRAVEAIWEGKAF